MFEDSLIASSTRRYPQGWVALLSFSLQTLFVAALIAMPMLFTEMLPLRALREIVRISPVSRAAQTETNPNIQSTHRAETAAEVVRVSPSLPTVLVDPLLPSRVTGSSGPPDPARIGDTGRADPGAFAFLNSGPLVTPVIERTQPRRWRVSGGVEQGLLIRDVKPIYPRLAQAAGVQGEVVLQAVIGRDGQIENLHAISGNPLLVKAALDSVQQWRYRPYLLNGEPVEVETQITVRFTVS
jgi:periplasmic protein TonB